MNKIISLVIILLFTLTAIGQKGIKYDIDKQTGDTLFSTKEKTLYIKSGAKHSVADYLKSTVYKSKTGLMLSFSIQTGRTSVFSIGKGAACKITFKDATAITIYNTSSSQSKPSRLDYGSYLFVFYRLDASTLQQLKNSEISYITIQSSTGEMEYPIKEKNAGVIGEQIGLFY